jgi:hypothetical protein
VAITLHDSYVTGDGVTTCQVEFYISQLAAPPVLLVPRRKDRLLLTVTAEGSFLGTAPNLNIISFGGPPGIGVQTSIPEVSDPRQLTQFTNVLKREDYRAFCDCDVWLEQKNGSGILICISQVWCNCGLPIYH